MLKLNLPLFITLPRKTKKDVRFYINQNKFRNGHFHIMNDIKRRYKEVVKEALSAAPVADQFACYERVRITYTLFPKSKRRMDLTNVLSAIQKFTDDALVELGVIPDDDYKHVAEVNYRFGGLDRDNSRVEMLLEEIE